MGRRGGEGGREQTGPPTCSHHWKATPPPSPEPRARRVIHALRRRRIPERHWTPLDATGRHPTPPNATQRHPTPLDATQRHWTPLDATPRHPTPPHAYQSFFYGPNELAPSWGNLANSPNPPNSPRGDAPETSGGADPRGWGLRGSQGRNPAYQPFLRPKRAGGKLRARDGRDSVEERRGEVVD